MIRNRFSSRRPMAAAATLGMALAASTIAVVAPATSASAAACSAGYVALTFDDGPTSSTSALLTALKSAGVKATMFNTGKNAQANTSLVTAQKSAGMWIGNHSYDHPNLTTLTQAQVTSQITQTQTILKNITGTAPKLFRPPHGATNTTIGSVATANGLKQIIWDVDTQDWNGATTAAIVSKVSTAKAGQVVLMHDGYATTRAAIPQIVSGLSSRGLCAGQISTSTGKAVAP